MGGGSCHHLRGEPCGSDVWCVGSCFARPGGVPIGPTVWRYSASRGCARRGSGRPSRNALAYDGRADLAFGSFKFKAPASFPHSILGGWWFRLPGGRETVLKGLGKEGGRAPHEEIIVYADGACI